MGLHFQYPFFAWLFGGMGILLLFFWIIKRWKRITGKKMGDAGTWQAMLKGYSAGRFNLKFILVCMAFALGVLAVMNLRKPSGDDGVKREGIDVVFALDLSKSMLAKDVAPSRLERAKLLISKMISAMPGNRVGLVWFAGKAYVQMPISGDHAAAQMFVAEASPDVVPLKGTVIGEALEESIKAFGQREAKYKAVILISDGEDHDEKALEISKELSQRGLMVNTIGIGSPQGTFIPDDSTGGNKVDEETGRAIVSKLNEQELQQIAANTHGVYVHLTNNDEAVSKVMTQLSQIDKKVTGDINLMNFSYYFWWFTGLMFLLLVAEQILSEGKQKKTNK